MDDLDRFFKNKAGYINDILFINISITNFILLDCGICDRGKTKK